MGKLGFWLMVGVASIVMIYLFKMVASQTGSEGLKSFANAI